MGLYIIGNKHQRICKIGVSDNPQKRLRTIQTGCPYKVELLLYIKELSYDSEKEYHKRYSKYRMQGEWFMIKGELRDLIYSCKEKPELIKPKNIKIIPEISDEEKWQLTKKERRYKTNSKHIKNVFNPR